MDLELVKGIFRPIYMPIMNAIRSKRKRNYRKKEAFKVSNMIDNRSDKESFVFYLGVTAHSNLGDMAQYYCIRQWIEENYPDKTLIEIEAYTIVDSEFGLLNKIGSCISENDRVVFQSGYTTQDLGGVHDLMHRMVAEAIPQAKILMMPQTVFYQDKNNQIESGRIYSKANNMLFLARDRVSYNTALDMMPTLRVELYPDIVTSLIGKYSFENKREGICICRRNDGEKFYTNDELALLANRLKSLGSVHVNDTTIKIPRHLVRRNCKEYVESQIEEFSKFNVVITDRYHGTIFSLIAGTPVIIIKTTDHKVVTGADWFKGVYDDYVYVASDLDDAYERACRLMRQPNLKPLKPYFKEEYYSKLKGLFEL
ncbi:MAG: polysaccharide pyruvyl transferase family protein [Muribaculum sp.]|nr:polysaccharide pyruvyl transferase family protein [Muribaculum sp.]